VTSSPAHGPLRAGRPVGRRSTGATPVTFSGPAIAAHPELAAKNVPLGTLNNCANGYTPWGTYLACEENWNSYFGTTDATDLEAHRRAGPLRRQR
jgi:secreted PhoX family phosphatase